MLRPIVHSHFFRLASWLLKHFLLLLAGIAIAYLLAHTFWLQTIITAIEFILQTWLLRLGIVVICVLLAAIVYESLRY